MFSLTLHRLIRIQHGHYSVGHATHICLSVTVFYERTDHNTKGTWNDIALNTDILFGYVS